MAKIDISDLLNKRDDDPSNAGRLTAAEFNKLVGAVIENQQASKGVVKGINYNGTLYKNINSDGILQMTVLGDTGRSVKFQWIQEPPETISKGGSCIVEFNVIDQQKDDKDASKLIPYDQPGKVNFYVDEKLINTVSGVYDPKYSKYTGPVKFDFSKFTTLSTKSDGNSLKIEYVNSGVVISKYYTVRVLDLSIIVENISNVYTTNNKPNVKVTVRGADSLLFASVDDKKPYIIDGEPLRDGIPFNISDQFESHNTHGIHVLKIWAKPAEFEKVSTDVLTYNYIFGNVSNTTPIVMTTITENSEFELYGKMNVEYVAYISGENGDKDISIVLTDSANYNYLSTSQRVSFVNGVGSNKYAFTLFPNGTDDLIGDRKLVISIIDNDGKEHKHITNVKITDSSVKLEQTSGYAVYLTSNGRSNNESPDKKRVWRSVGDDSKTNPTIAEVEFDDSIEFLDTGSGWCYDGVKSNPNDPKDRGTIAMHLQKGKKFRLKYKPFETNPVYNSGENYGTGNGLTISMEFATRNCLKENAEVIKCIDYSQNTDGRGFIVTASDVKLVANDIELKSKFKEDTRIKLDLVIEGSRTLCDYKTVVGTDPTAPDYVQESDPANPEYESLALVYIDGVYTGITLINPSTTFQHGYGNEQLIEFGSNDCDLDVYNIRIYNRALTVNEIVKNYSYDTPVFSEKIAIAQRNDIFSKATNNLPTIDIGKLRKARPDLPFFYVTLDPTHAEILPQNKSDWKKLTMTTFQNPKANSGKFEEPKTSFEAVTGVLRNQGTSSMTYPWPWRNWDWKTGDSDFGNKDTFKYYFPDYSNPKETSSKWHQLDYIGSGSELPIKKITLKKDYASSEMCNNAICSDIFTDMALGIASKYKTVVSPAMRKDLNDETKKYTNLKLALKAIPCFMFHKLENPNAEGSAGLGIDGLGMMNLIPNKNEVGYLGFKKNKWENADEGATEREQSWELCDNLDDVFWVTKLDPFKYNGANQTFVNMVKDKYEARTPKDSCVSWGDGLEADFGMTPKGMETIDATKAAAVRDEQKDIVDFHNWLVDTNQHLASGEALKVKETWNNDGNGAALYTHDTKEYRRAKFKNEAPDRLLLHQWLLYYIWREQFWMFDSGFKNLQVYTVGPNPEKPGSVIMQWGCMVRDADTALGIENTGKDYFPPHIEDIDYYTETDGKITFHYGGAKDIYDITELKKLKGSGANAVLNGQFGSIWVNLRDCFSAEIGQMYRDLCNNTNVTNFGSYAAIKKFRDHQEHWCENLYNFGMRQYFGGKPFSYFNKSALGDKKNSRASWLDRGFYYRRGKYRKLEDNSAFRINRYESPDEVRQELDVKSYIPMYIGVGGTTADMINSKNVIRLIPDTYEDGSIGKPISVGEEGFNFPSTGDAVSYIYGTNMITDIGDLARVCKLLRVQTINFPKLRELNLGHEKARDGVTYQEYATRYVQNENGDWVSDGTKGEPREFRNEILPNLDCTSLSQLTLLDVTNHTNLGTLVIDKCNQLQKLYARGTILKSINLPATTSLETIYLPSTLTSLKLVDLTGIKEFFVESLNDCARLEINNCGSYMASESYEILKKAIDKLENSYHAITNPDVVSLRGINWTNADQDMLERLININADLTGDIKVTNLSNDLKVRLVNKYDNIDDPNNPLRIKYNQESIESASIMKNIYAYENKDYQLTFSVFPEYANTYKSATWTLDAAALNYAEIDSKTGLLKRNNVPADDTVPGSKLTVEIEQIPYNDGDPRPTITLESMVYFYERLAKPGDIVFNDGTFSDEKDPSKTPIGVCFYVDPEDNTKRLMTALEPIKLSNGSSTVYWGAGGGFETNSNGSTIYYGCSPNLKINGVPYSYNLKEIDDINNAGDGVPNDYTANLFTDDIYRDGNNSKNKYFKHFDEFTWFGDLGWKNPLEELRINELGDGTHKITLSTTDKVPSGYYKTLAIIQNRNKLLDAYKNTKDQPGAFIRPIAKNYSELNELSQLLIKANSWNYEDWNVINGGNTYGSALYYPAASLCFAYEPIGVINLAEKFKKYNWFLPSSGELARLLYYINKSDGTGTPVDSIYNNTTYKDAAANAFDNVLNEKIINRNNFLNSTFYSSTETGRDNAISIYTYTGRCNSNAKSFSSHSVIPICVF